MRRTATAAAAIEVQVERGPAEQVEHGPVVEAEEEASVFPRLLQWMRQTAGHTRAELARRLGVSPWTVRDYEAPESNPREDVLRRCAGACWPGKGFHDVLIAGLGMMRGTGESMRRATAAAAEQGKRAEVAERPAAEVAKELWTRAARTKAGAAWAKARAERREEAGPFSFPKVLIAIRRKTGASRIAWAEQLGVSREAVRGYELPGASPGETTIKRYAKAAGRPWLAALIEELEAIRDGRSAADGPERVPIVKLTAAQRRRRQPGADSSGLAELRALVGP